MGYLTKILGPEKNLLHKMAPVSYNRDREKEWGRELKDTGQSTRTCMRAPA
jgi:hypothetical protein